MKGWLSACAAIAACGLVAAPAAAHRGPATVLSLLGWKPQEGARAMRLNEGLALASGDRWQYVCPALWGEEDITPAESLSADIIVIAAGEGLYLLDSSGVVSRHPDPAAVGRATAFARAGSALFALRSSPDISDVVKIEADKVHVIWSAPGAWGAIAGDENGLHVVRIDGAQLEAVALSATGEVGTTERATPPEEFGSLSARMAQGKLWITAVTTFSGLRLGQIQQGMWLNTCDAYNNLSGPVESDGRLLVTIDGALTSLDEGCDAALTTSEPVSCIDAEEGRSYACTKSGASSVQGEQLGSVVFQLRDLQPPDVSMLAPELGTRCCAQWTRYQQDLLSVGLIATTNFCIAPPTAGGIAGAGGIGGASQAGAAAPNASGAGSGGGAQPPVQPLGPSRQGGGCAAFGIDETVPGLTLLLGLGAALFWMRRRRSLTVR